MAESLAASGAELVTMALRRVRTDGTADDIIDHLDSQRYRLLPNTSGVRNAKEAILAAELAREALGTNWLKLEIHPDPKYLMPDAIETLLATRELVKRGFVVLPYVHADPVLCKQLEEAGAAAVMPLGAPIGSNLGLETRAFLEIIIAQSRVPVVIDAGLGTPSHAAAALEMGADAVLVNTAIASASDPVAMGAAFKRDGLVTKQGLRLVLLVVKHAQALRSRRSWPRLARSTQSHGPSLFLGSTRCSLVATRYFIRP
jgi:thiazole synthase